MGTSSAGVLGRVWEARESVLVWDARGSGRVLAGVRESGRALPRAWESGRALSGVWASGRAAVAGAPELLAGTGVLDTRELGTPEGFGTTADRALEGTGPPAAGTPGTSVGAEPAAVRSPEKLADTRVGATSAGVLRAPKGARESGLALPGADGLAPRVGEPRRELRRDGERPGSTGTGLRAAGKLETVAGTGLDIDWEPDAVAAAGFGVA
jgi:hypothetical protein